MSTHQSQLEQLLDTPDSTPKSGKTIRFEYTIQGQDGRVVRDAMKATSLTDAMASLAQQNVLVINIRPVRRALAMPTLSRRVNPQALIRFTGCLATLFNAGISIARSLQTLAQQEPDTVLKNAVLDVTDRIEKGATFSKAFGAHPEVFSRLYVSLLKVGETTGGMVRVLTQLADFLERDYRTVGKAQAALRYPMFVLATALLVVGCLFVWVLPPLLETCVQFGGPGTVLPLPTRVLQAMLVLAQNPFAQLFAVGGVAGGLYFVRALKATPAGRYRLDRFTLGLPLVGDLVQKIILARFSRCWGMMIAAGVSVHSSLDVLSVYLDNAYFRETIVKKLASDLMDGVTIAEAAEEVGFFPDLMVGLMRVGEHTGELSRMLFSVARYYDQEVEHAVEMVLAMIEPLMIGAMGLLVCFVLLSVFLPLYQVVMAIH